MSEKELKFKSYDKVVDAGYEQKLKYQLQNIVGCSFISEASKLYVYLPNKIKNRSIIEGTEFITVNEINIQKFGKIIRNEKGNKLLIPCGEDLKSIIESGLVEFEDYICEEYVNKKIVIIYGNCHTTAISDYLEKSIEFNEEYFLYRIKPIHMITDIKYFEKPIFKYCDVFIHQSIQLGNRYGEEFSSEKIIKRLHPECKVIAIPNVYRLPVCFFPQYTKDKEFKRRDGTAIFFRDSLLDSYAKHGIKKKQAYQLYMSDKSFSDAFLENAFKEFLEKVKAREADWDIKCLDYIENNYKRVQLFYDPNHPTNEFILYVVKELLKYMNIEYNLETLENGNVTTLSGFEMPILPEVKKYFGMEFPDNQDMRRHGRKVKLGKMNGEDYVSQYLACEWQNPEIGFWYKINCILMWLRMKLCNRLYVIRNRKE